MLIIPRHRIDLLDVLPVHGVIAEIGVQQGNWAEPILRISNPEQLHLVDPWAYIKDAEYQAEEANISDEEHEVFYQSVKERFKEDRKVKIHRKCFEEITEDDIPLCDWMYIDANHSFKAVTRNLHHALRFIKPNGILLCHDYTNHIGAKQMNFGVTEAVKAFCDDQQWTPVLMTNEAYPTVALAKDPNTITILHDRCIRHYKHLVEVLRPWEDMSHILIGNDKNVACVYNKDSEERVSILRFTNVYKGMPLMQLNNV